jgi:hypothetical protein
LKSVVVGYFTGFPSDVETKNMVDWCGFSSIILCLFSTENNLQLLNTPLIPNTRKKISKIQAVVNPLLPSPGHQGSYQNHWTAAITSTKKSGTNWAKSVCIYFPSTHLLNHMTSSHWISSHFAPQLLHLFMTYILSHYLHLPPLL